MHPMYEIRLLNVDGVAQKLRSLPRVVQDKAIAAALNKTADKARAEMTREITATYAIKAAEVRNSVSIRRARASAAGLEVVLNVFGSAKKRGRSLNLIHFLQAVQGAGRALKTRGSKLKKKDLSVIGRQLGFLIRRDGGVKTIPGAFVGNRGRTIFRRIGKSRLPIEPVQVIGVSQMFRSRVIFNRVVKKINDELPIEVDRAVRLTLDRMGL